jgi:hypothetical protein
MDHEQVLYPAHTDALLFSIRAPPLMHRWPVHKHGMEHYKDVGECWHTVNDNTL